MSEPFLIDVADGEDPHAALLRARTTPRSLRDAAADASLLALTDPALAAELRRLRDAVEVRPAPATSLLGRVRTRLAWWLLGDELRQISQAHASISRLCDSLTLHLDAMRASQRQIVEQLADRAPREGRE
jgi:hypothetical protein